MVDVPSSPIVSRLNTLDEERPHKSSWASALSLVRWTWCQCKGYSRGGYVVDVVSYFSSPAHAQHIDSRYQSHKVTSLMKEVRFDHQIVLWQQ